MIPLAGVRSGRGSPVWVEIRQSVPNASPAYPMTTGRTFSPGSWLRPAACGSFLPEKPLQGGAGVQRSSADVEVWRVVHLACLWWYAGYFHGMGPAGICCSARRSSATDISWVGWLDEGTQSLSSAILSLKRMERRVLLPVKRSRSDSVRESRALVAVHAYLRTKSGDESSSAWDEHSRRSRRQASGRVDAWLLNLASSIVLRKYSLQRDPPQVRRYVMTLEPLTIDSLSTYEVRHRRRKLAPLPRNDRQA